MKVSQISRRDEGASPVMPQTSAHSTPVDKVAELQTNMDAKIVTVQEEQTARPDKRMMPCQEGFKRQTCTSRVCFPVCASVMGRSSTAGFACLSIPIVYLGMFEKASPPKGGREMTVHINPCPVINIFMDGSSSCCAPVPAMLPVLSKTPGATRCVWVYNQGSKRVLRQTQPVPSTLHTTVDGKEGVGQALCRTSA
eukprot:1148363-Pelagomonas_calceolata.AAC.4